MLYAPQAATARHIARSAQQQIKSKTGIKVDLVMLPPVQGIDTPSQMLGIIASALEMSPDCYALKSRHRNIVELRFIGAWFLRRHFQAITLHQIAALFGGQDHTSVLNGLARANDLLHTHDDRFMKKYNTALKSVNRWLRNAA